MHIAMKGQKKMGKMDNIVERTVRECSEHKEEILRAFIAKYGFEPDRIVQFEYLIKDGNIKYIVKRLDDHEYSEVKRLESELEAVKKERDELQDMLIKPDPIKISRMRMKLLAERTEEG